MSKSETIVDFEVLEGILTVVGEDFDYRNELDDTEQFVFEAVMFARSLSCNPSTVKTMRGILAKINKEK